MHLERKKVELSDQSEPVSKALVTLSVMPRRDRATQ